ncbi:unnamed protein product [Periconia digitata]|uniref:Uncharacterized protein n=1 Tax=Periconia digitata TaxID=1303443 RepID=A0A9W4U3M3_9PLEO|nr:unnamed protein product [Periconia digitata]
MSPMIPKDTPKSGPWILCLGGQPGTPRRPTWIYIFRDSWFPNIFRQGTTLEQYLQHRMDEAKAVTTLHNEPIDFSDAVAVIRAGVKSSSTPSLAPGAYADKHTEIEYVASCHECGETFSQEHMQAASKLQVALLALLLTHLFFHA